MAPIVSRGFRGRRAADADPARVPPGQDVTQDFPVLSAGPTPHTSLELWDFSIVGELDEPRGWTWGEFRRAGELGGLRADVPESPVSASMQARSVATSRRPSAGLSSAARSTH